MKKCNFMRFWGIIALLQISLSVNAEEVDYSVISVGEESGTEFTKITNDGDCVCMPEVKRSRFGTGLSWYTNRIIDISSDGNKLGFLSQRNQTSNIFIKDLNSKGGSIQRTNRQYVLDFSFSPDGKYICFSEKDGRVNTIYQTSAEKGYVCRQFTSGNKDYAPVYSFNMENVFFARQEKNGASIWSYNIADNYLSNYTIGMNPYPLKNTNKMLCIRMNNGERGEIWMVDIDSGTEECILADPNHSFSTPSLSPNGEWILCVGSSVIEREKKRGYANTDIFVCKIDGTNLHQLTYHAADDLSPVWSKDGKSIYFISQRGSSNATANVWKMNFTL